MKNKFSCHNFVSFLEKKIEKNSLHNAKFILG